ncbi:MAG: DegV family protein [Ruminococcaceae bacterium]|nr:DegV family protein [Oscillospiraceae bacterium]
MENLVFITDSGCDLSAEMLEELGVKVLPLTYTLNGTTYANNPDHREYDVSEFYKTIKSGAPVSTSAVNVGEFLDAFTEVLEEGKDFIYIGLSSGISATFQNANNAAEELKEKYPERKIAVIDSLCASMGEGLLVYLAVKKAEETEDFSEVVEYVSELRHNICHEFTVDDLGQLKRGGRISPAVAFVGSMLQIKPMLYVSPAGKLIPLDKVRGRRIALSKLAEITVSHCVDEDKTPIFISHGDCEDEALAVADIIKASMPGKKVVTNYIGPVIGAHSGFKTLAVFCVGNGRGESREK